MKDLSTFISQYAVSKTLRFELIPTPETEKHIREKGILDADEKLAVSYKRMKETMDDFHKDFIDRALSTAQLRHIDEYCALYWADAEEKNSKKYADRLKAASAELRKEIVQCFDADDAFKKIDKKEFIKDELETWINEKHPMLYYDPDFKKFTTYFEGYRKNRMNLYSDEEKAGSVAYRLIGENLPKFLDNIRIYEKVKASKVAGKFSKLCKDMEQYMNGRSLDEMFSARAYPSTLTQTQIDQYNTVIGGRNDGSSKLQGLNEYINLYNQQHPDAKLPIFKMLYKQLLSDRISASWLPEAFDNAQALFDGVEAFAQEVLTDTVLNDLQTVLNELPERDAALIYVRKSSVNDISSRLFGYYSVFNDALDAMGENEKTGYISLARLQSAVDGYIPTLDKDEYESIVSEYAPNCVTACFFDNLHEYIENISDAYEALRPCFGVEHDENYQLSEKEKTRLKAYLDGVIALLHFIKPLYIDKDFALEKDEVFYSDFMPLYEKLSQVTKLYDKVRSFASKKPYSTKKIKLNFGCSTLLSGWDVNKETQNLGVLLIKDGNYYLGIMDKANNKLFSDVPECQSEDCYQKVVYKLLQEPYKMLPKVFFSKSRINEFAPSEEIMSIRINETFKKGPNFIAADCHKLVDFYKTSISRHPDWRRFEFKFSPTGTYVDINDFYQEVAEQGYKLFFKPVSTAYIDSAVSEGKLYLFRIYNKDFSPSAKGKPNLHTMYWKALFDEKNLADVVYKLSGHGEVFYRRRSIDDEKRVIHPANKPIDKRNSGMSGETSVFDYDIIKDRRYTVDKFQFHVPISLNFKAHGVSNFNEKVCTYLKNNPDVNIIGIDRGERNLLYISMIDRSGRVVKDSRGNYIQYSLNTITGEYKNADGAPVKFSTPYHELLDKKEKNRREARENWGDIESIKELKAGYMSQVVYHISRLMVEYNAIVVMEDLNSGFKNGRKKVEKQVYQNFEKALIEKLNYLVFKDYPVDTCGGLYRALQLTDKFKSFGMLTKQTGFLFYVPAWNTSKIDPVTGFVDMLKPKYKSIPDARVFFSKFNYIRYNDQKDWFEFSFDYGNFTDKADGTKTDWTLCTYGSLRYAYNKSLNNGHGGYEKWNVTDKLKALFSANGIEYADGKDLKAKITAQNKADFYAILVKCLQVTLAMRYSSVEDGKDFILSPVADENGVFFCSEGRNDGLPQDADANGAYNIARKGLCVLEHIDVAEKYSDWSTKISNKEWLNFVQTRA